MSLFVNENPILGPTSQVTWNDGTLHYLAGDSGVNFSGSALANQRALDVEPTVTAASVAVTGSIAAVRGNMTISAATTITSGFVYGTQGKITAKGTLATANFVAGLIGQMDFSAVTSISGSGPISCIWADCGASVTGSITTASNWNGIQITNTTGCTINSALFVETNSTYLLDVSNASYSPWFHAGAPTTLSGSLKINTSAGVRYIALYTTQ